MLDSALKHELMRCLSRCFAEETAKVRCTQSNTPRQFIQRNIVLDVRLNKLSRALHPVRGQSALVHLWGVARNAVIPHQNRRKSLFYSVYKQTPRGIAMHLLALQCEEQRRKTCVLNGTIGRHS